MPDPMTVAATSTVGISGALALRTAHRLVRNVRLSPVATYLAYKSSGYADTGGLAGMTISDFVAVWTPYNNNGPPTDVLGNVKRRARLVMRWLVWVERLTVVEESTSACIPAAPGSTSDTVAVVEYFGRQYALLARPTSLVLIPYKISFTAHLYSAVDYAAASVSIHVGPLAGIPDIDTAPLL
jgi:hypothetical protein